jgi:hypothetical protein
MQNAINIGRKYFGLCENLSKEMQPWVGTILIGKILQLTKL